MKTITQFYRNYAYRGLFILLGCLALTPAQAESQYLSQYTSLKTKDCISLDDGHEYSIQQCPAFAAYELRVIFADLRQSLTLAKDGKEYPLDFYTTISGGFSALGDVLEWRFEKTTKAPKLRALITRFNVEDQPDSNKQTSYLVVTKITADEICVVDKVPPVKQQNEKARRIADKAHTLSCLKP